MARYLQNKDKFRKYRVVADYNKVTNDFPRTKDGMLDDSFEDVYIKCSHGNMIYSYGKGVLVAYIPSTIRGKNILNSTEESKVFNIEILDKEVSFRFKYKDLDEVATLLKARNNQKNQDGEYNYISPFSTKNLPKTKLKLPDDKLHTYKEIIAKLGDNSMLIIKDINNNFINSLTNKKYTIDDIKADMKLKGLKGKEYFYSLELWDSYIEFMNKYISEKHNQ